MAERTEAMTAASAPRSVHEGSYMDWPAILAGAVCAVGVAVVFSTFGAGLGLSSITAEAGAESSGFGLFAAGAWMLVTALLAYAAGGYIAGRMRRRVDAASADEVSARDGIHGIVVWAMGVVLSTWLVAGAIGSALDAAGSAAEATGNALGGVSAAAGDVVGAAGSAVGNIAQAVGEGDTAIPGVSANPLEIVNDRLLRGTGVQLDQNAGLSAQSMTILATVAASGEIDPVDSTYLAQQLAQNSNLSVTDAQGRVDTAVQEVIAVREAAITRAEDLRTQAIAKAEEAEQAARNAAETARKSSILTAFALTAALLIAGVASMWAASIGGRHRDEGRLFAGFRSI